MTELEKAYADLYRFNQKEGLKNLIITAIRKKGFRHICYLRWYQSGHCRIIARLLLRWSTNTTGLDIHFNTSIGPGFVLHHPFNIAINGRAVLGKNVSLHHGCTIGAELRGKLCIKSERIDPVFRSTVYGTQPKVAGFFSVEPV